MNPHRRREAKVARRRRRLSRESRWQFNRRQRGLVALVEEGERRVGRMLGT